VTSGPHGTSTGGLRISKKVKSMQNCFLMATFQKGPGLPPSLDTREIFTQVSIVFALRMFPHLKDSLHGSFDLTQTVPACTHQAHWNTCFSLALSLLQLDKILLHDVKNSGFHNPTFSLNSYSHKTCRPTWPCMNCTNRFSKRTN
jgi:hypothetical protein